jgi:hypothetical protein
VEARPAAKSVFFIAFRRHGRGISLFKLDQLAFQLSADHDFACR